MLLNEQVSFIMAPMLPLCRKHPLKMGLVVFLNVCAHFKTIPFIFVSFHVDPALVKRIEWAHCWRSVAPVFAHSTKFSLQVLLCFFFFFSSLAITHKEARALSSSFSSSSSFISLAHSPTHTHSQTHPYSHTHIHSFSFQLFHTSSHNFEMLQDRNFSSYLTTSPNFTLNVKAAPIEDFGKNITSSKCKWENTSGSFKCEKNTKWSSHFKMSCNNNILARPNFKVTMQLKFSKQLDFQLQWIKNNSSEQEMFHFWIFQIESIWKFAESASFSSCTCSSYCAGI